MIYPDNDVSVRLGKPLFDAVAVTAAAAGMSPSEWIRARITDALAATYGVSCSPRPTFEALNQQFESFVRERMKHAVVRQYS